MESIYLINKLIGLIGLLLLVLIGFIYANEEVATSKHTTNITNPLIYNRLRDDYDYLQIYRNFQSKELLKEEPIKLKLSNGPARMQVDKYYESKLISADNITRDDLILEALDRIYLSRYITSHVYNYDNPEDRRKASDQKLVSPSRCASELSYLKSKLELMTAPGDKAISPELAAFFDSYAMEEPGVLYGNYHWTGNWRQCSKRLIFDLDRTNTSNSISFQGRYCMASIRSDRWEAKIKERAEELMETHFKSAQQHHDYKRFFRIQVGICLPESCDSTSIEQAELSDIIRQLALRKLNEPFKSYKLVDLFCLPDETSELRQLDSSGKLIVGMALVWCSLIVAATWYDLSNCTEDTKSTKETSKSALDKFVSAMSLKRNYTRLTRFRSPGQIVRLQVELSEAKSIELLPARELKADDLTFMDFFKTICMPSVLWGHLNIIYGQLDRFPLDFTKKDENLLFHYALNVIFMIDWYLVMTAFVVTYISFVASKKVTQIKLVQWLYVIFQRYWRLAPLYTLLFFFCRSVFQLTGKGPIWDYGTTNMTLRGICKQESWFWPITLTSNLHSFDEECILPSWYLSVSMQFFLITPFILIGLARWPRTTWLSTIAVIIWSLILRIRGFLINPNLDVVALGVPRADLYTRIMFDLNPLYSAPQYRISTYLMGILAGHYCYMVLSGQWRSSLYPIGNSSRRQSLARARVWFLSAIMLVALMFVTYLPYRICRIEWEPYARALVALFYGIVHTLVGLFFSLLLVTFMFGQFEPLKRLLSHPIWTVISRVNFSLMLIHCELAYYIAQIADRAPETTSLDVVGQWIILMSVCYPLAALSTLLLEFPLSTLEREFIANWLANRSTPKHQPKPTDHVLINNNQVFDKAVLSDKNSDMR